MDSFKNECKPYLIIFILKYTEDIFLVDLVILDQSVIIILI